MCNFIIMCDIREMEAIVCHTSTALAAVAAASASVYNMERNDEQTYVHAALIKQIIAFL